MVYIEPTTYVLGLLEQIRRISPFDLDVVFLRENFSQEWGLTVPAYCRFLDQSLVRSTAEFLRTVQSGRTALAHLCGWGGDRRLLIFMAGARLKGVPVFVESDTQPPFDDPGLRRLAKRLAYPWLFRLPFKFLPGGTRQADYLRRYGVPDEKIRIVNMTADVESISRFKREFDQGRREEWRSRLGLAQDAIVFLFVGRLEEHKGIGTLLGQFARMTESVPAARLVLVGDGAMGPAARARSQEADWLRVPGRLRGDDLFSAYCSADVFVLPSRFEPWGLVVNEAMAAGLPVVVSDRVGCGPDLVEGQDTGLMYAFSAPDDLELGMRAMALDCEERQRMGRNAGRLIGGWTLQAEAERICREWGKVP